MVTTHFHASSLSKEDFLSTLNEAGYVVVEGVFGEDFTNRVKQELEAAIASEAAYHGTNNFQHYGMLIACPVYGGAFLQVADNPKLMEPFNWVLDDTCIIYVYTSSSMPPGKGNYSTRIHVDRPHFIPGYTEAMGCLILLDDFTEENGATWVLPGSHLIPETPDETYFYQHATRIIAPKGSVFYFHLRLWHAGGENHSGEWRHSLGIGMIRGHLKQRIDLPRAMKDVDISNVSDYGLQKLGFFAQPPTSLDEFYAPPEKRPFRQRSEWEKS